MKKSFVGYYTPSETYFDELWASCLFAVDANVLLNLYRYSPGTREDLIHLLQAFQDRIWLPHQAGLEFFRNRPSVINTQSRAYEQFEVEVGKARKAIQDKMREYRYHPVLNAAEVDALIHSSFNPLSTHISTAKASHPDYSRSDAILSSLMVLFENKIGPPYDEKRMGEIASEGERRYARQQPPGYRDRNKEAGYDRFGDLIVWKQILDVATAQQRSVMLVTDDTKEDWWWREGGHTYGPHPQLVQEFRNITGKAFHAYPPDIFMERARRYTRSEIRQSSLDEAKAVTADAGQYSGYVPVAWTYERQHAIFGFRALVKQLTNLTFELRPVLDNLISAATTLEEIDAMNSVSDRYWTIANNRMEAEDWLRKIEYSPAAPVRSNWKEKLSELSLPLTDPNYSRPYPGTRPTPQSPRG